MFRSSAFENHRYPPVRRSDGDSVLLLRMAATGLTLIRLEDILCFMRRDTTYEYMSQDQIRLMRARRQSLHDIRHWLNELGIPNFNHLHRRAWSNHLVKEAESLGGFAGLGRATRAIIALPSNRRAFHYFRRRLHLKFLSRKHLFHKS